MIGNIIQNNISKNNRNRGFTLIEVMVSMGIFFVMASVSYMQNPTGFTKIKFNTYINELSVYIKELSIYGSSAGDLSNGKKVGGAGIHIERSPATGQRSIIAFYDISIPQADGTYISDYVYTVGVDELTGERISYDDNVIVLSICPSINSSRTTNAEGVKCQNGQLINYDSVDITFARPSTKAKLTLTTNGVSSTYGGVAVTLAFKGIPGMKCLRINYIGLVTLDDSKCFVSIDIVNPNNPIIDPLNPNPI